MTVKAAGFSRRHSASWVLLHSLLIGSGLVNLSTGFRIATQTRPEILRFSALLPQGLVHELHFLSGAILLSVAVAYLLHLYVFRAQRRQIKRGASLYHRVVFWLGRLLVLASLVSGCMLYLDIFSLSAVVEIHYVAALVWLLYLLVHGGVYFVQYGWLSLKRIVSSGPIHIRQDGILAVVLILSLGVGVGWMQSADYHDLEVKQVSIKTPIRIDGVADEEAWQEADTLTLNTIGGANFVNGQTRVTIKALHNGTGVFFHVRWDDPSRSVQHLPLVKTQTGWKVSESGFYNFDETGYYEDKLALMISDNCEAGAAQTAYLGPQPLEDKPPNWHGKGYHYTQDNEVHDVWHWKAVRTNDMFLADDNHIGPPDVVRTGSRRYAAGYLSDPKESGAYEMNWQWYRQAGVVPRRIPKQQQDLDAYQPGQEQGLPWSVPWYFYQTYDAGQDHYPVGTVMPSVLYMSNRFEGDRADVYARGEWADGQWSLELMRRLDTGSAWDVVLEQGVCLWVAAFDHAQIMHTRHARPIRLTFERSHD